MKPVLLSILFFSSLGWAIAQENSTHKTVAALREAAQSLGVEAEATFGREEAACHQRYQVFRCINEAQEKRLETLGKARSLSQQAGRVELAEKQRQVDEDAKAPALRQEKNAIKAAQPDLPERSARSPSQPGGSPPASENSLDKAARRQANEAAAAERAEQTRKDQTAYDARRAKREAEKVKKASAAPTTLSIKP